MVFTASGTFRGEKGTVAERLRDGSARIRLDGEDERTMLFAAREIIPLEDGEPHAGAE